MTPQEAGKGLVFDIQHFCVHDGPGIRTVVFLKGCNLRCVWCQNPESILPEQEISYSQTHCLHCGLCFEACPHGAIQASPEVPIFNRELCRKCLSCVAVCPSKALRTVGEWMTVNEVIDRVEADRIFFENSGGGVTFSGGEPVTQFDFLQALLEEAGRRHLHRTLETNGQLPWTRFVELLAEVDLVLFDVKHLDPAVHEMYTGADNRWIQNNLEQLAKNNPAPWNPRVPLIPGMNDGADYLAALGERLKTLGVQEIHLLPYHRLGWAKRLEFGFSQEKFLEGLMPPTEEEVEHSAGILRKKGLSVLIGG